MNNQIQKIMNAVIITGEYTDKQTGQNKKSYLTIGKLFIYAGGGMSLKLDVFPANNQAISFYDIKSKSKPQQQPQQQPNNNYGGNQPQQYNQYGR